MDGQGNPRHAPSGRVYPDARSKSEVGPRRKTFMRFRPADGRLIDRRHRRPAPDLTAHLTVINAAPPARRRSFALFCLKKDMEGALPLGAVPAQSVGPWLLRCAPCARTKSPQILLA